MTPLRLFAIGFIFVSTTVAWMILGNTVTNRSGEADGTLRAEVERLWGGEHVQRAPTASLIIPHPGVAAERAPITLAKSDVRGARDLEHRRKGLLWFPTYGVGFEGHYRFKNENAAGGDVDVGFAFPS